MTRRGQQGIHAGHHGRGNRRLDAATRRALERGAAGAKMSDQFEVDSLGKQVLRTGNHGIKTFPDGEIGLDVDGSDFTLESPLKIKKTWPLRAEEGGGVGIDPRALVPRLRVEVVGGAFEVESDRVERVDEEVVLRGGERRRIRVPQRTIRLRVTASPNIAQVGTGPLVLLGEVISAVGEIRTAVNQILSQRAARGEMEAP